MKSGLRDFLERQGEPSRLARWAVLLALLHLLTSALLALAGKADDLVIMGDSVEYLQLASYPLTDGIYSLDGVTSSGKREPGFSGFVMAFMAAGLAKPHVFTVANLWIIAAAQIVLYGLVCGWIARVLGPVFGRATAWPGLMLMQASPIAVYQHQLGSEAVSMMLLGLMLVEISRGWRDGPTWSAVLRLALWTSLLAITRSVNVLFIPVLCLLLWLRLPVRWPKVALFFVLALTPAMMWTMRNKQVFGLPIMGSIDGFSSLYRGNVLPYFQISSPDHAAMPAEAKKALAACKDDGEKYLWYKKAAIEWLKENPVLYIKQCIHRTAAMFIDLYRDEKIPWWKYPSVLLIGNDQLFLTIVLLACLPALWRRREIWAEVAVVFFVFSTGMYGAVYGTERYLHPAFFLLAPVHAWCLVEIVGPWLRQKLRGRAPA